MKRLYIFIVIILSFVISSPLAQSKQKTDVYILGTLHKSHLVDEFAYSFIDITKIIDDMKPDVICIEMQDKHLNGKFEGYYPPENAVIIECAKALNIPVVCVDWRDDLNNGTLMIKLTEEAGERINAANRKVEQIVINFLNQNNWEGYYDFIQNNIGFHEAIKNQHDTKIEVTCEEADGFWLTRNKNITNSVKSLIEKQDPNKVLVTIGLHHKYILTEYLSDSESLEIKGVPEITQSQKDIVSNKVLERWKRNLKNLKVVLNDEEYSKNLKAKIENSGRIKELEMCIETMGKPTIKIKEN
jgi:hypothetical protein